MSFGFQTSECDELFEKVVKKTRTVRQSAKNGFELQCTLKIVKSNGETTEEQMTILQYKNKYCFRSQVATIYQDQNDFVVVQHDQKQIFITKPQPQSIRDSQFEQIFSMIDSLQKYMTLKGCAKEFGTVSRLEGYRKLTFAPQRQLKEMGIKVVNYWIHEANLSVRKIMIEYDQGNDYELKAYELTIDKLSYAYEGEVFSGKALDQVLAKNNRVLQVYSSFKVVDNRKRNEKQ